MGCLFFYQLKLFKENTSNPRNFMFCSSNHQIELVHYRDTGGNWLPSIRYSKQKTAATNRQDWQQPFA
jgi:hypothetical protein